MTGPGVTALQTALQKDGESVTVNGTFDDQTAAAVTGFQEKYASQILAPYGLSNGTGYVGSATRAKLNSIYGCVPHHPTVVAPISTSASALIVQGYNPATGSYARIIAVGKAPTSSSRGLSPHPEIRSRSSPIQILPWAAYLQAQISFPRIASRIEISLAGISTTAAVRVSTPTGSVDPRPLI